MAGKKLSPIDLVKIIMGIEAALEIEIPDEDVVAVNSPRDLVECLTLCLEGQLVGGTAALFVGNLARQLRRPELDTGPIRTWRREQIEAVVREVLRVQGLDDWSDPPDVDVVGAPLKPRPHPRLGAAKASPGEKP